MTILNVGFFDLDCLDLALSLRKGEILVAFLWLECLEQNFLKGESHGAWESHGAFPGKDQSGLQRTLRTGLF